MNWLEGKKTFLLLTPALVIQILRLVGIELSPDNTEWLLANWDSLVSAVSVIGGFWGRFVAKPKETQ